MPFPVAPKHLHATAQHFHPRPDFHDSHHKTYVKKHFRRFFFAAALGGMVAKSLGCARCLTHRMISHDFRTASHIGPLWEICMSLECPFDESIRGCTLWHAPQRAFCPGGKQTHSWNRVKDFMVTSDSNKSKHTETFFSDRNNISSHTFCHTCYDIHMLPSVSICFQRNGPSLSHLLHVIPSQKQVQR